MNSAAVIILEHARQARDRAERLRRVAEGLNASHLLEQIEATVSSLDHTADQLEKTAAALAGNIVRTGNLAAEISETVEQSRQLIRRSQAILGRKSE